MSLLLVLSASTASADCCVCTACGPAEASICRSPSFGCDAGDCDEVCAGCGSFEGLPGVSCGEVPQCSEAMTVPVLGAGGQAFVGLLLLALGFYALTRSPRLVRGAAVIVIFFGSVVLVRAVGSMVLSGTWSPSTASSESIGTQQWSIALTNPLAEDLEGSVTIGGGAAGNGTFRGRRQNDQVTGTITDDSGGVIAEVTATLSDRTLSGTYTTPAGASGTFNADLAG